MQKAHSQALDRSPRCPPMSCKQTVSGTISLSSPEYFSPFPHGTGSLSVAKEYLALGSGLPRFPQDFSCPVVLGCPSRSLIFFDYRAVTFCGSSSQMIHLKIRFVTSLLCCGTTTPDPTTPKKQCPQASTFFRFGLFPFRSPLLRESLLLSFPRGT